MGNTINNFISPFKKICYYWTNHRFETLLVLSLIIFIGLYLFDKKYENTSGIFRDPLSVDPYKSENLDNLSFKKKRIPMKNEQRCRKILENYYKVPFNKCRPDFLKYKNGKNLELDGYNPELKIAFEYNGQGHAKFTPFFHNSYQDFLDQIDRDKFKNEKCKEFGIKLINIPHTVKYEELEKYIHELCK